MVHFGLLSGMLSILEEIANFLQGASWRLIQPNRVSSTKSSIYSAAAKELCTLQATTNDKRTSMT